MLVRIRSLRIRGTAGLIAGQRGPARCQLSAFLLNGALFVLVGLELQSAVRGLTSIALTRGLIAVGAVSAAVICLRR